MREVTIFYAYDDSEFDNRDECLAYEGKALENMKIFDDCYIFYDENKNIISAPESNNIDDWLDWLYDAAVRCIFIMRIKQLPEQINKFISRESSYCILNEDFNDKVGLFKWDSSMTEWVKVDE